MRNHQRRLGTDIHRLDISIGRNLCQIMQSSGLEEMSGTNGRIIRFLSEHESSDVYQRDLEREFGITRSTASRVLALMEQKGLVVRSGVAHDARLKKLTLTAKSRSYSKMMQEKSESINRQLLKGFTPEEEEQLYAYLERLQDNVACRG